MLKKLTLLLSFLKHRADYPIKYRILHRSSLPVGFHYRLRLVDFLFLLDLEECEEHNFYLGFAGWLLCIKVEGDLVGPRITGHGFKSTYSN